MIASTHVSVSGGRRRDQPVPEHPAHYAIHITIAHHKTLYPVTEYSAYLAGGCRHDDTLPNSRPFLFWVGVGDYFRFPSPSSIFSVKVCMQSVDGLSEEGSDQAAAYPMVEKYKQTPRGSAKSLRKRGCHRVVIPAVES